MSAQLYAAVALPQVKVSPVPTEKETGWVPEPVWTYVEERVICYAYPRGIEPRFFDRLIP